jgi:purine-nucleoside/S-methyl-5'-thioadenosine phosphorylase / adenosine deaminase
VATADSVAWSWQPGPVGPGLRCTALDAVAPHVFTSRHLRFRAAGDFEALGEALGVDAAQIVRARQVHGRTVAVVSPQHESSDAIEADALVSFDPRRPVAVRVADCVPVLLADRGQRGVAAVHAGWRGTCAGVVGVAVEAMHEAGVAPGDLIAAIGPSIGPCCYQVDERVRSAFLAMTPDAAAWFEEDGPGRWKLDLWRANAEQLEASGVPAGAIHQARVCTADSLDRCFSYRREGPDTGRMVAAIRPVRGFRT